jgi:hypothetical protein
VAQFDQPIYSGSDTTAHKKEITDRILLIDPVDTPFIDMIGLNSANGKFRFVGAPNTTVQWLEDTMRALSGTLSATCASDATALTVSDATDFKVGDVVLIGSEKVWVAGVDTTNNTLSVTRAFAGSTAATHATGTVTIQYVARNEAANYDTGPKTDVTVNSNYTMILEETAKVSGTHDKLAQYGIASEMDYQVNKKLKELYRFLERACFYGLRTAGSGLTSPRSMGGLDVFITDNTATTAAANLVLANLEAIILSAHLDGGKPDVILTSPTRLQTIKNLYDNSSYLRVERATNEMGMVIEALATPWGRLRITASRWCPDTRIYVLQSDLIGMYEYRPFFTQDIAIGGDWLAKEIIGEYSLVVAQDKAHGYLALS